MFNTATTFRLVDMLNIIMSLYRCGIGGVIRGLRRFEDRGENEINYCAREQCNEQEADAGSPCALRLMNMPLPHFKYKRFDDFSLMQRFNGIGRSVSQLWIVTSPKGDGE